MKLLGSICRAALLAGTVLGHQALELELVEKDVTWDGLQDVLWNFNKIARDHGGNRAFGLPGYNASLSFILQHVVDRFGKHLDTYVQEFTHFFQTTNAISLTGPDGSGVEVATLQYNVATPLPGGVTAALVDTPVDDARGSGCFGDQWKGVDVKGKIALVKSGVCAIADKVKLAREHGALAVVLYEPEPGNVTSATLGRGNVNEVVPTALVGFEDGQAWSGRLAEGLKVEVTLVVDAIAEYRPCWNVISETKEGDPNNVVMLGAHLDSVQAGPGVNDDGSGSAALVEIMKSFTKFKGFKNKVRFAWWGAEESGLIGSLHYTSKLTEAEANKIRFYFNYDMIGSPKPIYAVYADNDAHKTGGAPLLDYLLKNNRTAHYRKFGSSSDYVGFLRLGIPSSGIFTGAGAPTDVCYHQACDDINNINKEAMEINAKAAGYVAAKFAMSLDGVPGRSRTSVNPKSRREVRRAFDEWDELARVVEKEHSCSGHGNNFV